MPIRRRSIPPAFLAELCRRLSAAGAERIWLFGSHARGEADEDSDVDLVVVQRTELPFFERIRALTALVDPDWRVDLLVYTPDELATMLGQGNAFAELIQEEGVELRA